MYRVYVIKQIAKSSQVLTDTRTQTPSFAAAAAAFWALFSHDFDKNHLLLMTKNNKQINAYRYCSAPGDRDYLSGPDENMLND